MTGFGGTDEKAPRQGRRPGVAGLVEVVDRLRSPGGCPWDADQSHVSLAKFAVEESYELADAIASGSRDEVIDELGDVLYQVVFHARLGAEGDKPFDLDDVAERVVAKLHRRHPHVFGDVVTSDHAVIEANWDVIKAAEKPERISPLDGIPASLAPLERAAKIASRYRRAGALDDVRAASARAAAPKVPAEPDLGPPSGEHERPETELGARLLTLVIEAVDTGVDPGTALTGHLARVTHELRAAEGTPGDT